MLVLASKREESAVKLILRFAEGDDFNCPIPDYVQGEEDSDGEKLELFDRDRLNGWIESVNRSVQPITAGIKWRDQGDLSSAHIQVLADAGALFIVSKYEHSGVRYYIAGSSSYECSWDTTRLAGVYLLPGYALERHQSYEDRYKFAKERIAAFSAWCDGSIYEWILESADENFVSSSYAVVDHFDENGQLTDALIAAAVDMLKENGLVQSFLAGSLSLEIENGLASFHNPNEYISGLTAALSAPKAATGESV